MGLGLSDSGHVRRLVRRLIGYERKSRMKEAGIRTHFIVGIGVSLMMVVSKYGFQDQTAWANLSLDPSRIAVQVISGVGFIDAGVTLFILAAHSYSMGVEELLSLLQEMEGIRSVETKSN
ncbi:UNVERIFIED_CONTAM: putative membrane protein YhiD involved in acid resistance [Paenibacillus sp. PvR008]